VFGGQRLEAAVFEEVVLDEHVVPQFEEARAFTVDTALMGLAAQVVALLAQVEVDFRARSARTKLGHLPEVFLAPEEQDVVGIHTRLLSPNFRGLIIARDIALVVLEAGSVEFILG